MVGKEGSNIVDIGANRYIAGFLIVMGGDVTGRNSRESYTRHDESNDKETMKSEKNQVKGDGEG